MAQRPLSCRSPRMCRSGGRCGRLPEGVYSGTRPAPTDKLYRESIEKSSDLRTGTTGVERAARLNLEHAVANHDLPRRRATVTRSLHSREGHKKYQSVQVAVAAINRAADAACRSDPQVRLRRRADPDVPKGVKLHAPPEPCLKLRSKQGWLPVRSWH